MFSYLKKTLLASGLAALFCTPLIAAQTDIDDNLPDMGTTAGSTLSVDQEMQMGDFYVRQLRASARCQRSVLTVY